MKLKSAAPAAAPAPAEPISEPADDAGFDGLDSSEEPAPSNDKPFDDEPFDAGVEADESTDPKTFIEQLTGKLGQSLRKYTEQQGQPDFDLEKFAINSVISATHTAEMDEEDRKDIIKKINTAGDDGDKENNNDDSSNDMGDDNSNVSNGGDSLGDDMGSSGNDGEEGLQEGNFILDKDQIKRSSIFAPEGSKEAEFKHEEETLEEGLWDNIHAKRERGETPAKPGDEDYPNKKQWNRLTKEETDVEGRESLNYMFWQNLQTIHHATGELLEMNQQQIDELCSNGHAWAVDHVATSSDDIEEVYHFFEANINEYDGETEGGYEDEYGSVDNLNLNEAEYQGKKVKLGKPTKGDVKKFKVYVKNKKGNVVKVNFGDPNMEIRRDNDKAKKSFRARHKCSQAKDRTTPKYWSCKMWSSTPVSKMVGESDLTVNEKSSTFDKKYLKNKLQESFNQEETMNEPIIEPQVEPAPTVVPTPDKGPNTTPSRKNRPFLPMPGIKTDPKAMKK